MHFFKLGHQSFTTEHPLNQRISRREVFLTKGEGELENEFGAERFESLHS